MDSSNKPQSTDHEIIPLDQLKFQDQTNPIIMFKKIFQYLLQFQIVSTLLKIIILTYLYNQINLTIVRLGKIKYFHVSEQNSSSFSQNNQSASQEYVMIFTFVQILILKRFFVFAMSWFYRNYLVESQRWNRFQSNIRGFLYAEQYIMKNEGRKLQTKIKNIQSSQSKSCTQSILICAFLMSVSTVILYYSMVYNQCMIFLAFKSATPALIFIIYGFMLCFVSSNTNLKNSKHQTSNIMKCIKSTGQFIVLLIVVGGVAAFKLVEKGQSFYSFAQLQILSKQTFILLVSLFLDSVIPIVMKKILGSMQKLHFIEQINKWYVIFTLFCSLLILKRLPFINLFSYLFQNFQLTSQTLILSFSYLIILPLYCFFSQLLMISILKTYNPYFFSIILISKHIIYKSFTQKIVYYSIKSQLIKLILETLLIIGIVAIAYLAQDDKSQKTGILFNNKFEKISTFEEDQEKLYQKEMTNHQINQDRNKQIA